MPNATVGVVANPVSGKDVRRLVANAGTSTVHDKVTIVRRVLVGAVEGGASRFVVLPDPHGICARALSTLRLDVEVEEVDLSYRHDGADSTSAAVAMKEAGCGAVVVLGGDGTNRAVARGWPDAPVLPLSTGTNNVFPVWVEPTVAGYAAGLVASGRAGAGRPAKVVRIEVDGEADDLALVDAVLVADRFVGSRALFDPDMLRVAVLTRAEPASVGISAIGGLLSPCGADEEEGVVVRFGDGATLRAPMAPGLYADVPVASCERVPLREAVTITGPGVLALDGERERVLQPGQRAVLRIVRDGPRVIDVEEVVRCRAS